MKESGVTALDKLMAKIEDEPSSEAPRPGNSLIVIRGDQATEKPLRWMWKPYLPLGKLVHFGGNFSQAKSPVTVDLVARIPRAQHGRMVRRTTKGLAASSCSISKTT